MKDSVFSVEVLSLFYLEQKSKQAIKSISTKTIQKLWKNMNARINYVVKVNDENIEQKNI